MPRTEPQFDVTLAVPALARVRQHAASGDYGQVAELLLDINDRDETAMPSATSVVAATPGVEAWLGRTVQEAPTDYLARTLLAHRQVIMAWDARSGLQAHLVGPEQFATFHRLLREAEGNLIRVCAEDSSWSLPWVLRLMTGRGLELGLGEIRRRYQRVQALVPDHFEAQSQMLQRLCPKWGGTWEETFAFSRERSAEAPQGTPSSGLVAVAHLERWVDLGPGKPGRDYLAQRDVGHELEVAAQSSVLHAGFTPGPEGVRLHTIFGMLQSLAGNRADAGRHFRALGTVVDEWAWGYLGGARATVARVRGRALARG